MSDKSRQAIDERGVKRQIDIAKLDGHQFDESLAPEVLTDKEDVKVLPCRVCGRPCIVTRFASAGKTACSEHKARRVQTDHVHAVDTSKEPHVLTDKAETKQVPCRHCGRPCVVTRFASPAKVACLDCRQSAPKPKKVITYKEQGGVRTQETHIEIADEHHQEWQDYVLRRPHHFDSVYVGDERERHEAARRTSMELARKARTARSERRDAEWALADLDKVNPRTEQRQRELDEERAELEVRIAGLEGAEAAAETQSEQEVENANRLGRIAYLRGALAVGWRIEIDEDHRRYLVRGERRVRLPHDYLDPHDYKTIESEPVAA